MVKTQSLLVCSLFDLIYLAIYSIDAIFLDKIRVHLSFSLLARFDLFIVDVQFKINSSCENKLSREKSISYIEAELNIVSNYAG